MEETGTTNPKYVPPIASFMAPIRAPMLENHPFGAHLPIIVPLVFKELLNSRHRSCLTSATAIQSASCHQINFARQSFFSFFHFHRTLFMGLRDAWHESRNLYLKHSKYIHLFV